MLQTPTAATETTRTLTRVMVKSTDNRLSPLSTANLFKKVVASEHKPGMIREMRIKKEA